jgi:hypothetical protein
MALIREDKFSPYIRVGGYLFRPVPTRRVVAYHEVVDEGPWSLQKTDGTWTLVSVRPTKHTAGSKVPARHRGGTPYAQVGEELWIAHGESARWDEKTKRSVWNDSTDCYKG